MCFFFFQAEDGIRDYKVTGVQTCALPISSSGAAARSSTVGNRSRKRPKKGMRSEEHTSELQSPCNLVCRLLLEKKKTFRPLLLFTFVTVVVTLIAIHVFDVHLVAVMVRRY